MKTKAFLPAILGGLALFTAGCGDDGSSVVCGAGTTEVNGVCQPDGDVTCATGTVLQGNECVPDGTVICETGTTYDDTTGTCVADIDGCGTGTVLVGGECVPEDDTLAGDVMEPAEPNGFEADATPGLVTLPAVGDDVVIEGCIEPRPDFDLSDNSDGDVDVYVFQPTGPTLLDITVDGVGGMSGAFNLFGIDAEGQLLQDGWSRLGLNLVGDTTQRQVFLPKAGTYVMMIADSRTFAFGQGVGDGTTTCYFATVANVAIPSPTAISGTTQTGTLSSDAQFFSVDPAEGDLIRTTLDKVGISDVVDASLVTMVDDVYIGSVETASPAFDAVTGLTDTSNVVFVVEESSNLGLTPTDFTLDLEVVGASAMPADGTISVVEDTDDNFYYFDVAAADTLVEFTFDDNGNGNDTFSANLVGQRESSLGAIVDGDVVGKEFAYFASPGRYYLRVTNNDGGASAAVDVAVTRANVTVASITKGTGATGVGVTDWPSLFGDANVGFVQMDVAAARWLSYTVTPTDFGEAPTAIAVPRGTATLTNLVFAAIFDAPGTDFIVDGDQRIFDEDTGLGALVAVVDFDPGNAGGTPTFDISVDDFDFTGLGAVDEANPVSMTGITLPAASAKYFLFNAGEDTELSVTVTPDGSSDAVIDRLNNDGTLDTTVDAAGTGVAETTDYTVENGGAFAFGVAEEAGLAGTFDLSLTALDPSYSRALVDMDLSNACTSGTRLDPADFTDGVTAAQTIGFNFDFYGVTNTELYITDRGWLAFTAPADSGTGNFDDAIAPMASDNFLVDDICVDAQATSYTVQWRGNIDGDQARFQATLHSDGSIDFGYAAGNDISESSGTAAITDAGGAEELPWRGEIDERTVITYTPKP